MTLSTNFELKNIEYLSFTTDGTNALLKGNKPHETVH